MCAETANEFSFTTGLIRSMVVDSLKRDWVRTKRPCSMNNEPMPWSRRCFLWERKEPRWRGTYGIWVEEKLKARLQLGMKVRERSVVVNGRVVCSKGGWSLVTTDSELRHSDTTLCDRFFGRDPQSTPEVLPPTFWKRHSWHGRCLPYVYDRDDDYSSCYDPSSNYDCYPPDSDPSWSPQHHHQSSIQSNRLAHHEENHEPERPSHTANTISTLPKHHSQNILRVLLADDGQAVFMIRIPWSGLSGTPEKLIHSSSTVILLFASLQSWLGLGHSSLFL